MQNLLRDLEEDYDPYYLHTGSGISGSTLETSRYDRDEDLEYAGYMGMKPMPYHIEGDRNVF